ncbi:MAG: class I SAM-dependent rRNA methyltransferase [Ruminococcus sp.]|uniref:class I SAM-dependent rRNA methyltransferase n=1 Tax=Ruminococcus sp. TaxID=41978 RepID=UPI0028739FC4|nr:class I SAM-dependent rRNA methyltransferase [Ruminococcus sp.]MBQ3285918.1 class I SAM-dependent rRNA methyltransferase [Ruminococcus sp.]
MDRGYPRVTVSKKCERFIKGGHVWVYHDEILAVDGKYENGDIVDVLTEKGRYLGSGYINDNSKIRVRIISKNANDRFDEAFYRRRIDYAIDYRLTVMGEDFSSCRLIFGEADGFPGLTVDKFENVLVTQVLSLGIDRVKEMLFRQLVDSLQERGYKIEAVYERNDVKVRELEGLDQYKGFYPLAGLRTDLNGEVIITENGIRYHVDYFEGQKTGFFLDQKYNRRAVAKIASGKRVLDCFTHTGAFALNAARTAEHVTAVDVSQTAIDMAKRNAALNGITNVDFVTANVFELLTQAENEHRRDREMIILDPPAFTKSRSTARSAERGYKEINLKAMKLLPRGGYLATCSCSHFMPDAQFRKMLFSAAADANVSLRQIECRQQSPDHPILWGVEETDYLKFYIFQVV